MTLSPNHKKLLYVSSHRGTKEADILIGHFAEQIIPQLKEEELEDFKDFLDLPDMVLIDWYFKRKRPEPQELTPFVKLFLEFKYV